MEKSDKKPPYMTIEELAEVIKDSSPEVMWPEDRLPPKYSRDEGIVYDWNLLEEPVYSSK